VNYETIPSVVYTYPKVAWIGRIGRARLEEGQREPISWPVSVPCQFPRQDELDTADQIKFSRDRILGVDIIDGWLKLPLDGTAPSLSYLISGPNAGEMIGDSPRD
jgi:hypothetical protein